MTYSTPPPPPPAPPSGAAFPGGRLAASVVASPRALAAWALVGYVALYQFFVFVAWIVPSDVMTFTVRSANADFRSLLIAAMPVLAVLLATNITPALAAARLVTLVALIEYAVAIVFGFATLLIGLGGMLDRASGADDTLTALRYVVMGLAALGLIAVAAYVVLRAWRRTR